MIPIKDNIPTDRFPLVTVLLVMLGLWFAEQAVFGAVGLTNPNGRGGGVAYFAHVGGFAFGVLTIRWLATRRKRLPPPSPPWAGLAY